MFLLFRHNSIKHKLLEKEENKINHEEDGIEKVEHYPLELGSENTQKKHKRDRVQHKLPSKINHHDRCSSSMYRFFIHYSLCPPFSVFRDEILLQMMSTITGEKELNLWPLII